MLIKNSTKCFWFLALSFYYFTFFPGSSIAATNFSLERSMSTTGSPVYNAPRLVDLDGNPATLEILVGDDKGYLTAFSSSGAKLWEHKHSMNSQPTPIIGSPAIGDFDGDGLLEVAVGLADRNQTYAFKGLIYALDLDSSGNNPTEKWYIVPEDRLDINAMGGSDGVPDGCIGSPALGDVNGDGRKEVIIGCWDTLVYVIDGTASGDATGSILWNHNPTTTGNTHNKGFLSGDTIWASPALADVDGDGKDEVFMAIDTHDEGGAVPSGLLPFQTAKGGAVLALEDNTSQYFLDMTFFKYLLADQTVYTTPHQYNNHVIKMNIDEVIWSSPAIGDIDNDGQLEIVHGTGGFYGKPGGTRLYAWNLNDSTPAWGTDSRNLASAGACDTCGVDIGSTTLSSPALGDLNGDGVLDVVIYGNTDKKLFAVNGATGAALPGFPITFNSTTQSLGNADRSSPVIADVDGDGVNEIAIVTFIGMMVVENDGTVSQEVSGFTVPGLTNILYSTPAIGDIDNDGMVEAVFNGDQVHVFQGGAVGTMPWPQFRHDALGTGNYNTVTSAASLGIDIKANGSAGPVTIKQTDNLTVGITINGAGNTSVADWWAVVIDSNGSASYYDLSTQSFQSGLVSSYQGALLNLGSYPVLNSSSNTPGSYTYYFGVDLTADGNLTMNNAFYDSVVVNVTQ